MDSYDLVMASPDPLELLDRVQEAIDRAAADAVGVSVDDPDNPHVAVAVHAGRIVYIGISDPMAQGDVSVLQDVLNACIFTAFSSWAAQQVSAP